MKDLAKIYDHQLKKGLSYPMVLVKPGIFKMGSEGETAFNSEKPEHLVQITKPFYIGVFPVTQDIWSSAMGNKPSYFKGDRRPVEQVSWIDIVEGNQEEDGQPAFLNQLNQNFPAKSGWYFRLPTEAEWEYAAKGGHLTALKEADYGKQAKDLYTLYSGGDKLKEVGWYLKNSHSQKKEVGLLRPNDLGLYDMSGNVFEWCHDWFDYSYYEEDKGGIIENPTGSIEGHSRVVRGGGWLYDPQRCRVSCRLGWRPAYRGNDVGFRLVLSPRSQAEL